MLNDKALSGTFIGLLANAVMDIPQYPLWKFKILMHPLSHYAGSLFLDLDTLHHSWIGSIVGFLADYSYSAFLGILFVYFFEFTGRRYFLSKGLLFGTFIWFFSFGGLRSLTVVKLHQVPPGDWITIFLLHLLFGLALGMATRIIEKYFSEINRKI